MVVLPRFFIDRPIFATVLSLFITLAGALAVLGLPVSQYPEVTPPTIQVDCNYPGASAKVVSETIAAPIEQRVNGVEGMLYMSSQCTSDGSYTLTVTFEIGFDLNMAQVLVQNRVNLAMPELPEVVRATGVTTRKRSPELLLTVALRSPAGRYDQLYLSNYAVTRLKEELARIPGISDVTIFGQKDYSMRIWLDPEQLATRGMTALDVVEALRGQNLQVPLGLLGPSGDSFSAGSTRLPLVMTGRLHDPEQFGNVVLKSNANGGLVRVRDVARIELGAKSLDVANRFDRQPTIGLAIFLLSDANALETADAVKSVMAELSVDFPEDVIYEIGYDTTPFIRESIHEVFLALRDAVILVALVVLVFLQSWRAAMIPLATVPVAIVGTFAAMAAVGFGLNNLTLFGLVLAVGIVVDDAIVVVEAVQHHIERGLAPRDATLRAMEEVSGPVIAVGVVLTAVFLPCAFLSGIVGEFFRQFALTIAISTLLSTVNSLSLSPALCALLLKGPSRKDHGSKIENGEANTPKSRFRRFLGLLRSLILLPFSLPSWAAFAFNRSFDFGNHLYIWTVGKVTRVPLLVLTMYGGIVGLTYWGYLQLPTGFVPAQDKGYLLASIQLPDAASAARTQQIIDDIAKIALATPGVRHTNAVAGNSFVLSAYGSNFGSMFIILDDFDERRHDPDLYADAIAAKLRRQIGAKISGAQVNIFGAPAVPRLGRAGGIKIMIEDRGDVGPRMLQGQTENLIEKGNQQPGLVNLLTVFRTNSPQLSVNVDAAACSAQGVEVRDVYATMQATLGARYVNDFNLFGRTWQVIVQADQKFRNEAADIRRLKIRNHSGQLVPLASVASVKDVTGPLVLTRYNMYPAAAITGAVASGTSSGDAAAVMEQLAIRELPPNMAYEWTELTFIEQRDRNTGIYIFGLAVGVVFLVLAALYESWSLPLAVILVVPMCVGCSLFGVWLSTWDTVRLTDFDWVIFGQSVNPIAWTGFLQPGVIYGVNIASELGISKQDVNIFTQVGFVVLIGLACKNSILIVEFAKRRREAGIDRRTAVLEACHLRLRPILMTSFAFVLGVLPLVLATGAGAEMRQALGLAVFSGMVGVTVFGIFLTPVFYVIVDRISSGIAIRFPWLNWIARLFTFGWIRRIGKLVRRN